MRERRQTSKVELVALIEFWKSLPRGTGYHVEASLIQFLHIFTPDEIAGAMYIATSGPRENYFNYLCGILHKWKKQIESGEEHKFFQL